MSIILHMLGGIKSSRKCTFASHKQVTGYQLGVWSMGMTCSMRKQESELWYVSHRVIFVWQDSVEQHWFVVLVFLLMKWLLKKLTTYFYMWFSIDEKLIFNSTYVHFKQELNFGYTRVSDKQRYLYEKRRKLCHLHYRNCPTFHCDSCTHYCLVTGDLNHK